MKSESLLTNHLQWFQQNQHQEDTKNIYFPKVDKVCWEVVRLMKREGIRSNRVGKNVQMAEVLIPEWRETKRNTTRAPVRSKNHHRTAQNRTLNTPPSLTKSSCSRGGCWSCCKPMMALILGWHAASRTFSRCGRPVAWWLNTDSTSASTHLHRLTDTCPRPGAETKAKCLWHNVTTSWFAQPTATLTSCPVVLFVWSCTKRHLCSRCVQHRDTHQLWFVYPLPSNFIFSVSQQVIDDSAQAGKTGQDSSHWVFATFNSPVLEP